MNSYAGSIAASFSVDHNGGSNYAFKFDVPPGIAGMQPELSFNYSSLAGNNLLGVGCQLNGLSVIERCGASYAQDGFIAGISFSDKDRLMIDQSRLVVRNGVDYFSPAAIYETELQSWHKVVPVYGSTAGRQGPDSFIVYQPNGRIYQYGGTPDSQGTVSTDNPTIQAWYLNSIRDRSGNTITFSYINAGTGSRRFPSRINYTSNGVITPRRSVRFNYENRNDADTAYMAGYAVQTSLRLASLATFVDDRLVTTYSFKYEYGNSTGRSRLLSVTQSDLNAISLPATAFNWQDAAGNYNPATPLDISGIQWGGSFIPMDVNGNGCVDFVNGYSNNGTLFLNIYFAQADGSFSKATTINTGFAYGGQLIALDANGDGKMELVYAMQRNNKLCLVLYTAQESNGSWTLAPGPLQTTLLAYGGKLTAADVDGDGLADLVYSYQKGAQLGLAVLFSDGANFNPAATGDGNYTAPFGGQVIAMDANADGRDDLLYVTTTSSNGQTLLTFTTFLSSGRNGFVQVNNVLKDPVLAGGQLIPLDVNADGNVDLIYVSGGQTNKNLTLQVIVNNGINFKAGNLLTTDLTPQAVVVPASLTASSVPELLVISEQKNNSQQISALRIFNGQLSIMPVLNQFPSGTGFGGMLMPMDLRGKGFSDLLYVTNAGGKQAITAMSPAGVYPDLLTTINNGIGGKYTITYSPLTDPLVYASVPGVTTGVMEPRSMIHSNVSGAGYNVNMGTYNTPASGSSKHVLQRTGIPKYVVASYQKSDGVGGQWRTGYTYANALIDRSGRGWLGFEAVSIIDDSAGTTNRLRLLQLFPYSQLVSQNDILRTSDSTFMQTTSYSYSAQQTAASYQILQNADSTEKFSFTTDTTTPDTTQTTSKQFDAYGNITRSDITGNALAADLTHTMTYINDEGNWIIGLLSEQQHYADSGLTSLLSHERYTYDKTTYLATAHSVWENVASNWLTTSLTYDALGNMVSKTDPTGLTTAITIEQDYHTFIQSRTVRVNGKTLSRKFRYEPAFGQLISKTETNGAVEEHLIDGIGRITAILKTAPDQTMAEVTQYRWEMEGSLFCKRTDSRVSWKESNLRFLMEYSDGLGRTIKTMKADATGKYFIRTDTVYNGNGQKVDETIPYLESDLATHITRQFDAFGRMTVLSMPAADGTHVITNKVYPDVATEQTTTAAGTPLERTTVVRYADSPNGRIPVSVKNADGGQTTYTYNGLGQLLSLEDPTGIVTKAEYDTLGRQISATAGSISRTITYNDLEQSVTEKNGGQTITLFKDGLQRVIKKVTNDTDTTLYVYDENTSDHSAGMLTTVKLPSGTTYQYGYNADGQIINKRLTINGQSYSITRSYRPDLKLDSIQFPDGAVQTNQYTMMGILSGIGFSSADYKADSLITYENFDAMDNPAKVTYGNGLSSSLTYDVYGRLSNQQVNDIDGKNIFTDTIVRDATDAIVKTGYASSPNEYSYDKAGRLQSSKDVAGSLRFGYDQSGNCIAVNDAAVSYKGYAPQSGQGADPFSATYDLAGNLVEMTRGNNKTAYTYNGEQQLISAGKSSFEYDHTGNRLVKNESGTITYYVSPEYEVVQFPDGSIQHTCMVGAAGARLFTSTSVDKGTPPTQDGVPAAGAVYFTNDFRKSVRVLTDQSGKTIGTVDYGAFGVVTKATGSPAFRYRFAGCEYDTDASAYYMKSRYYDPQLRHFLSADNQLGGRLLDRDTYNHYAYVSSDPLGLTDATGHSWWDFAGQIVADVGMIALGIVVIAATGGALGNTVGSGLIGAGIGGLGYDIHQAVIGKGADVNWGLSGWGGQVIIGALTGLITGGVAAGLGPAVGSAAGSMIEGASSTTVMLLRAGMMGGIMAVTSSVASVGGKFLSNVFTGKPLASGLASAALFGAVAGILGGGFSATLSSAYEGAIANTGEVADEIEMDVINAEAGANVGDQTPIMTGAGANATSALSDGMKTLFTSSPRLLFGSIKSILAANQLIPSF